jgi:hypothetical protein
VDLAEEFALDGTVGSLETALAIVNALQPDIPSLLEALDRIKGDSDRKARAIIAIRAKLGLSVVPGPPCRPRTLR